MLYMSLITILSQNKLDQYRCMSKPHVRRSGKYTTTTYSGDLRNNDESGAIVVTPRTYESSCNEHLHIG